MTTEITPDSLAPPAVVVGIDGSPGALRAARWGARHAVRSGAPLQLVAAFGWAPNTHHDPPHAAVGPSEESGHYTHTYRDLLLDMREEQLDEAVTAAKHAAPTVTVSHDVRVGHPVPVLCAAAADAEVLVVGSRGLGGVAALVLGSTALGVAARAGCPVVVVRDEEPATGESRPVVVGVDQTPTSESALGFGFAQASLYDAPLVVAHLFHFEPGFPPLQEAEIATAVDAERAKLTERLARWSDKYPDVEARTVVGRDGAADGLIELSRTAQLIVVGSRGRGGFVGQLLGSVSQTVLHHAHSPVAVVRTEE